MLTVIQGDQEIPARDHREAGHFWADKEIVEDYLPLIGIHAFAVYMLLAYHARSHTGRSWPSIGGMAKRLDISEPTVRKALEILVQNGLILISANSRKSRNGKDIPLAYIYTLIAIKPREGGKGRLPGVVNAVDQGNRGGGKPDLPGVVKDVYPNKNKKNKNKTNTSPQPPVGVAPASEPSGQNGQSNIPEVLEATSSGKALEDPKPPVASNPLIPLEGTQGTATLSELIEDIKASVTAKTTAVAIPAKQAAKAPVVQAHIALVDGWIDGVGRETLPPAFTYRPFLRLFSGLLKESYSAADLMCAGQLYRSWRDALPGKPPVNWSVDAMTHVIRQALTLCKSGIDAAKVTRLVKDTYAEPSGFWRGKLVSFQYVVDHIALTSDTAANATPPRRIEYPDGTYYEIPGGAS